MRIARRLSVSSVSNPVGHGDGTRHPHLWPHYQIPP